MSTAEAALVRRRRNPLKSPFVRAFMRTPSGILGLFFIAALVVDAIIAPPLLSHSANTPNFLGAVSADSTWAHPFGTDSLGRDVFSQTLVSIRLTLEIALGAAGIAFVVGGALGTATAVVPPRVRELLQRLIDTMIAFPALILVIFITIILGKGPTSLILGIGAALSFGFARFVSTLALSIAGRDFVGAARVVGVRRTRVMFAHILPNLAEPLSVNIAFIITFAIVTAAALSFIGIGVQPPNYDLGALLALGVKSIYETPGAAVGPAAVLAVTALSFGFLGEGIARAINPLLWTSKAKRSRRWWRIYRRPRLLAVGAGATDAAPPQTAGPRTGTEAPATQVAGDRAPVTDDAPAPWSVERDSLRPSSNGQSTTLDVRNLVVSVNGRGGHADIVKGVSLTIPSRGILGIVGESGSGKTMTAMAIADLLPATLEREGAIELHGEHVAALSDSRRARLLGSELGLVFQDPMQSLNPALTVGRQLAEVAQQHGGLRRREAQATAVERLRDVHMPVPEAQVRRYPHELSGGMRQRVMIAMALMNEPSLLICDEPTTALDVTIQAQIIALLKDVNQRHGTSIILISHNLALVAQTCDRVLVMYAGRIVEDVSKEELVNDPKHPYTQMLMTALPVLGSGEVESLTEIPGEVPEVTSPPPGCSFHPRCPLARDICRTERPPLVRRPTGRRVACWVANEGED